MTTAKKLIISLAAFSAISAAAQEAPRTAYFLDGYSYRHELNPAFAGERNYISVPALANIDLSLFSNVGVNTFLYKTQPGSQYKLTTFMSPTVDANTFLNKLGNNNHINGNFDFTLLSTGFRAFKGFNTPHRPGHSHKINDKLNVGAKVKVLLGVGNATAHLKNMDVKFGHDQWQIKADGEVMLSGGRVY